MGNAAKRAVKNIRIVQQHGLAILLINVIFIGWRLYRNRLTASWAHYASLLPTSAVYAFGYRLLKAQAEDGSELFQKGLVEYCWDMVWVTMFVQLLACYTEWAWVLYSIPPAIGSCYGGYTLWMRVVYPWISKVDSLPEDDDAMAKRKAKAERQMRRQKGK
ncbi:hypothetical protein KFE25_013403 [Diacronema lutheri]|uniref:DUF788-domain-containing protein n=1 Tax=Diacronema lutheri TaxID=2081491 RepID=A0A8J6CFS8_DIALT|nr:hypothetical protein KFE25_013403 [Diacronema lutheri]